MRVWLKFVGRKGGRPRFSGDFPAEAGRPTDFSHTFLIRGLTSGSFVVIYTHQMGSS